MSDGGWFPPDAPGSPQQERKRALAAQLRELVAAVKVIDAHAAEENGLAAAESALQAALAAVRALPAITSDGGGYRGDVALFDRSTLAGRSNALAPPLRLWQDGDRVRGSATYGTAYEGPPGCVHGGHVLAAFDEVLGIAQAVSRKAGMTGTLTVRLCSVTPLDRPIDFEAWVESVDGRKVTVAGRSTHQGRLLAEAEAVFVVPRGAPEQVDPAVFWQDPRVR